MLARAEDGHADAFQIADHEVGVVAGHACMGKARQVGIGDGDAVHGMGQMAKARAEDQAKADGFGSGACTTASTTSGRRARAWKKPKSRQAQSAATGRHLAKMRAASAM